MTVNTINNLNSQMGLRAWNGQFDQQALKLKKLTNQFVNQVFYGTLLREFRNAQQPTILDGGFGASAFTRQLDIHLIERLSQQGDSPVAQALRKQLEDKVYQMSDNGNNKPVPFTEDK